MSDMPDVPEITDSVAPPPGDQGWVAFRMTFEEHRTHNAATRDVFSDGFQSLASQFRRTTWQATVILVVVLGILAGALGLFQRVTMPGGWTIETGPAPSAIPSAEASDLETRPDP